MDEQHRLNEDDMLLKELDVASSTECTGLIPTPPLDEAEYASYQTLYSMEIPQEIPQETSQRKLPSGK